MEYRKRVYWIRIGLTTLLIAAALLGITWANYKFAQSDSGGEMFMSKWMASRLIFTDGQNPYADETTLEVQQFVYGRYARGTEDKLQFDSPYYTLFFYLPFAIIKDAVYARAVWMTVLELCVFLVAHLSLQLANWNPRTILKAVFFVFSIIWYYAMTSFLTGDEIILVLTFLIGGVLAVRDRQDELAGVLFACSTIKPGLVIIPILYVFYWAFKQKRWQIMIWFLASLGILLALSFLFLPSWFLDTVIIFVNAFPDHIAGLIGELLNHLLPVVGLRIGYVVSGILAVLLMLEWRFSLKHKLNGFVWAFLFTLTIAYWVGLPNTSMNLILLSPTLVYIFSTWEKRWQQKGSLVVIISMVILLAGIWLPILLADEAEKAAQVSLIMNLVLPAFILPMFYWVRWWALKSPNVWYDEISMIDDYRFQK